jgi:enterochelin esterase-like enzyme/outer membrane protein assembly factor BamB
MLKIHRVFVPIFLFLSLPALAVATGWPHLRGPAFDGRAIETGVFDRKAFALEVAWRVPLGPAYSGIAVAEGKAVTLYSDGESDFAAALDAETGKTLWRYKIDNVYRGHDGSSDGPLSTPLIHHSMVYGLGPRGQLFALRLKDGHEVWTQNVPEVFGAQEPHFGFTTTPMVEGDVLVVQVGGSEGRSINGLNRQTGEVLWSRGDEAVEYQSPTVMTLLGQRQIVAVAGHQISGIAPQSGEVLWQHALGEEDRASSASPMAVGENRFLVFVSRAAAVFEAGQNEEGVQITEVYRSRELGGSYALPVLHEGHLYGFRGEFLTCINAATGERIWKSRPPGGGGLILVDDHLVIYGSQGHVVVAEASSSGYVEKARTKALEGSALTWPSFSEGKIYVRNLEEIASVAVVTGAAGSAETGSMGGGHAFGKFLQELELASDKKPLLEKFFEDQKGLPVVEGEFVHFVFQDQAEDVAIEGNFLPGGGSEGLEHVAGTDFYHKTFALEPGTRWEYRFIKDFNEPLVDPGNSRTVPANRGDVGYSELVLAGYEVPQHIVEPADEVRGTLETLTFKSELLDNEREVRVYLPRGYEKGGHSYPLLLVHDLDWTDRGLMTNTLDNLIGQQVEPVVVAFVAPRRAWWEEGGGSGTSSYVDMLVEEMVPFLESKYRLEQAASRRALMGGEGFGLTVAYGALKYPSVFGKVAINSVHLGAGSVDALMELIAQKERPEVELFLTWNRYDVRSHAGGIDYKGDSEKLAKALRDHGYDFAGGEVLDAHGWGALRAVSDDILEALFPLVSAGVEPAGVEAGSAGQ